MSRLEDQVIIITGAAGGIGQAYATRVAQEGAKVVACDIQDCEETAGLVRQAGAEVLPLHVDVTNEEQTKEMALRTVERFGRIDCLVNNAARFAGLEALPLDQIDMNLWDDVFEVNVKGVFLCCRAVVPYMRDQGGGKIINIASGTIFHGLVGVPHYVASKAAVMGLSRSLAKELGQYNINVNTLSPGATDSGAAIVRDKRSPKAPDRAGRALARTETPEDLCGTLVFLASSDSDFMTGQMIVVNGGDSLH